MRFADLGLTLFLGLLIGMAGAVAEGVIFREPRTLWSAQFYQWFSRSTLSLWWRDYSDNAEPPERRVQFLISFLAFFLVWIVGAVIYSLLR
jgi:hypothetical protein